MRETDALSVLFRDIESLDQVQQELDRRCEAQFKKTDADDGKQSRRVGELLKRKPK